MDNSEKFNRVFNSICSEDEFEQTVYDFLKSKCSEEEIAGFVIHKEFKLLTRYIEADLYLEKGIATFDWPEGTVVEIKTYLDYRTLRSAYNLFKGIQKYDVQINHFVIIFKESAFSFPPQFQEENSNIKIIKFENLVTLTDSKGKEDSDNEITGNVTEDPDKIERTAYSIQNKEETYKCNNPEKWKDRRAKIINTVKEYLQEDTFTLILGAGVSASANMPSWGKLLELILTEHPKIDSPKYLPCDFSNILHSCGDSYIIAARYINKIIDEDIRAKIIQKVLYQTTERKESDLIKGICKVVKQYSIKSILTTNYDQLVEQYLKKEKLHPYPIAESGIIPKDSVAVYHVHGVVNDPDNSLSEKIPEAPILSEDDYHALYSKGHDWSNITILNALQHTHCVFIGFSMTDPNLRRLMESAKYNDSPHYIFLPRRPLYEGYYDDDKRNDFHYLVQEGIMSSMGVNIIWYELSKDADSHKELVTLIEQLLLGNSVPA